MKRLGMEPSLWRLAVGASLLVGVVVETRLAAAPPLGPAEARSAILFEAQVELQRWGRTVFRLGQDYTVRVGDATREVVVVFGDAVIEGRVDRNVVVVLGQARLSSTATVDGSLVVIGGGAVAAEGAVVGEDLVVVGGGFEAPPRFLPGGEHIVIGPAALGGRLEVIVPWVTRGLLWGRPIVPGLPWVWGVVGIFFLVYLGINLLFDEPVRAAAAAFDQKPLTAFGVGLLVLVLTGPVSLLLAVSVIGLAVVPFVLCALVVAGLIGKTGVVRWIGLSVLRPSAPEGRLQALASFVIGFAVICVAYMVPVLGFVTWTMLGVFGLGAATLAFVTAYRRENPGPPTRDSSRAAPGPMPDEYERAEPLTADPSVTAVSPPPPPPAAPGMTSDLASFPRAAFRDRLAAFALDVILVLIAHQLLDLTRRDSAIFLLLLVYHIGFWTWKGTTVGGIICQLRVVRVDGAPLLLADAVVRGLSSIFSLAVAGIGCLWILKDPERQAWHDKIAGTYVVKVPRNWPL